MDTYALALSYAIPGFVLLVLLEEMASRLMGLKINRAFDTISSLSSGITNTLKSLLGLSVVIVSYDWMVNHIAVFDSPVDGNWYWYLVAFVGLDFVGYWSHRFNHVVNVFWNRHIIHHSSEEFNLSCALRQSISTFVGIYFFLYVPMALMGVPSEIVAIVAPIHFFAQFWYHTRLISRMGWLEFLIVTPSHHRVHHAINEEYLDRNFSEIFIVWDKMFGTFQKEMPHVPPVYGTKKPVRTWNPVWINFMHIWLIAKDAWRTQNWWDKIRIWFMPTGWRPEDVKERYPVEIIEDVFHRQKYDTQAPAVLLGWSWFQLGVTLVVMYLMLVNIANMPFYLLAWLVAFLTLTIFSYTTLMDGNRIAVIAEVGKFLAGCLILYLLHSLDAADASQSIAMVATASYLVLSMGVTLYYSQKEARLELLQA